MSSLINCVIKPSNEYGFYHTYGRELFCLLSRTCINMFSWEINNPKSEHLLVTLDNIEKYRALLRQVNVHSSPEVFLKDLKKNKNLPLVYNTQEQLIEIAELRLLQWRKYYRGKVGQNGNQIKVQFGSGLESNQESKLSGFLKSLYGENEK